jgi:hypothetical protein
LWSLCNRNGDSNMASVKLLVSCLSLVLWSALIWAQPAYEGACSNRCSTCSTISTSCTAVGSNRLAVVGESHYIETTDVTALTYGGTDITGCVVANHAITDLIEERMYRVINPAASAQTLQVTVGNLSQLRVGALLISGAHQTTPLGTPVTATGSGTTLSATVTTAADELVVALANGGSGDVTLAPGTNETERWSLFVAGENETAMYTQAGANGGVMSPSQSASEGWLIIAVPVKPAAAVGGDYFMRRGF